MFLRQLTRGVPRSNNAWIGLAALYGCGQQAPSPGAPQPLAAVTCNLDAGTSETGADPERDVPCDVAAIIAQHCTGCHSDPPSYGAPFSLTTRAAFQAPAPSDPTRAIYDVADERVNESDTSRRMPPASAPALSAADVGTLSAWLQGGAEASHHGCAISESGDASGAGDAPDQDDPGSGGASPLPKEYDDPDLECYQLTAFTDGDRTLPYSVPSIPDYYVGFVMDPPWQGTRYIRSFRSIIDNKAVLHHWLLFKQSSLQGDQVIENELGAHPDGEMIFGWAPGGSDLYLDPDVAMEASGDVSYLLEAHYNNASGAPQPDASGVELCVTSQEPTHVAGLAWVGTDDIFGTSATGTCTPNTSETIHLIAAQPHMHLKGRHMKVTLTRANGEQQVIHDKDFDFNYQRMYTENVLIQPGDSMQTECTYSDFAVFGKGTQDEMCYFFSIYWPLGSLRSDGLGTLIHGDNTCID